MPTRSRARACGWSICLSPERFSEKLRRKIRENNEIFKAFGAKPLSFAKINDEYLACGSKLRPFITDTVTLLNRAVRDGTKHPVRGRARHVARHRFWDVSVCDQFERHRGRRVRRARAFRRTRSIAWSAS